MNATVNKTSKLKELRQSKGINQVEMSIRLGMSIQNYVNYERGSYKAMSKELEEKISQILETTYIYERK